MDDDGTLTSGGMRDWLVSPMFRRTATEEDYAAAVEARSFLNTAIGITMGKHDCTRRTALENLQRVASQFDITLLELAKALISSCGR